jgi:NAD(P)-dependent dehydrogenase (short-subunit alcohol dehydrogenase family)
MKCDVRSWDEQVSTFQTVISTYGRVDYVITNASISKPSDEFDAVVHGDVPVKPEFDGIQANLYIWGVAQLVLLSFLTDVPN